MREVWSIHRPFWQSWINMNPFDYFESVSASIETYPLLALLIAFVGGLLSTST